MEKFNGFDRNTVHDVSQLQRAITALLTPRHGEGEAKAMTRLIFHHLKGWDATALIINADRQVSEYMIERVNEIVGRLLCGEPLQYVLGEARFYGMDLKVDGSVLIPRPETAELVDLIVRENPGDDLDVLDVGTGSGAIAIALSRNLRFPHVVAIDISEEALKVAEENARCLHAGISFLQRDVFTYEPEPDSFNIIVSNPPYIAESEKKDMEEHVLGHEPHLALFVPDSNPLLYYSRIATIAKDALRPGGRLYFEINPLFAAQLRKMLESEGFEDVEIINDSYGRKRFAKARRKGDEP